jgi:hypothetical protein
VEGRGANPDTKVQRRTIGEGEIPTATTTRPPTTTLNKHNKKSQHKDSRKA